MMIFFYLGDHMDQGASPTGPSVGNTGYTCEIIIPINHVLCRRGF